jgi:hypothetical protein
MLQILATWSKRCDGVTVDLENHINNIKQQALHRHQLATKRQNVIDKAVVYGDAPGKKGGKGDGQRGSKRDLDDGAVSDDEIMEMDEGIGEIDGGRGGSSSAARGTKRGRGRG